MSNVPSPNGAVSPHTDLLLEQLVFPPLSLQSIYRHAQHSQSSPRVASTVMVPAGVQPGTTSALPVPALSAKPCSTTLAQPARLQFEAALMQTATQVKAPAAQDAHYAFQPEAPFACAQPFTQVGAHFAACDQFVQPVGAQPVAFAADCDEKDANALLKLASRELFSERTGNKIRGFVADLELYLRMCARPVHHWGYFFMASLGAEEAEKVRRSHLAQFIADYP